MNRARRWMANLTLLNVFLAAILLGAALFAAWPFFRPGLDVSPAPAAGPAPAAAVPATATGRSPMDFAAVTEQNLFHPERRIPTGKEQPRPDLVLYGTLITREISVAYVEDRKAPYATPGRGKRQVALKKGGQLSGYVLKEVHPERIVLEKGDDRIVVSLSDDPDKRQPAGSAAPKSPAIAPAPQGGALNTPAYPQRPQPYTKPR